MEEAIIYLLKVRLEELKSGLRSSHSSEEEAYSEEIIKVEKLIKQITGSIK